MVWSYYYYYFSEKTHSTEAEVAGMPNSLLNNGRSEMHSLITGNEVRMFIKLKPYYWLIILSQILYTFKSI